MALPDLAQRPNAHARRRHLQFQPRQWPTKTHDLVFAWETGRQAEQVWSIRTGQVCAYAARDAANQPARSQLGDDARRRPCFPSPTFTINFPTPSEAANRLSLEATITPAMRFQSDHACITDVRPLRRCATSWFTGRQDLLTELCTLPHRPDEPCHRHLFARPSGLLSERQAASSSPTNYGQRSDRLSDRPLDALRQHISTANAGRHDRRHRAITREFSEDEAKANAEAYAVCARPASRSERIEVEARLVAASKTPTLAKIQPYRSALAVNEYAIDKSDYRSYRRKESPRRPLGDSG